MNGKSLWLWTSSCLATGVAVGCIVGHCLYAGAATAKDSIPDVIAAKAFHLVDANGKVRAKLMAKADSAAGLTLLTADGTPAATLVVGTDSRPLLGFFDKTGALRGAISITEKSDMVLNVLDKGMQPAAAFVVSATGGPAINVLDKNGAIRSRLGITDAKSTDPTDTDPCLLLFDKSEKAILKAP